MSLLYAAHEGRLHRVHFDGSLVDPMSDDEALALLTRWRTREQMMADRGAIHACTIAGNIASEIAAGIAEARKAGVEAFLAGAEEQSEGEAA